jgi:heterodisulfide reductase subunit B
MGIEDCIKNAGEYYGYPKCCVNYFVHEIDNLEDIHKERLKKMGDYYDMFVQMYCTPCPKCYAVLERNYSKIKKLYEVKKK